MGEERLTEEQGRQRLLDAAVELALEVGGPDFTVREVATRAGVNHGLVHRYFGTKNALTSAVIRSIGSDLALDLRTRPEQVSFVTDHRTHVLALLLTHSSAADHLDQEMLVGIQPVIDALGSSPSDDPNRTTHDPSTQAALRLATILGWVSNERLITRAFGLGIEQRAELLASIDSMADSKVG